VAVAAFMVGSSERCEAGDFTFLPAMREVLSAH